MPSSNTPQGDATSPATLPEGDVTDSKPAVAPTAVIDDTASASNADTAETADTSDVPASPDTAATGDAAPAQAKKADARVDVQAVATQLKQLFPALFGGNAKPLKLRVQADIQERAPGQFTKAQLSAFLRRYTGGTGYLIALSKARTRFDLDGQPAGELSDEHRDAAQQELTRRRGITDARRAEEDRGRNERAQLLRDFSQTTLTPANFCALKGLTQEQLDAQLTQARVEAEQEPQRNDRNDRAPRGGDPRRGGPRDQRGGPGAGPRGEGGRPPRRDGQAQGRGGDDRPTDGRRPPRQPR